MLPKFILAACLTSKVVLNIKVHETARRASISFHFHYWICFAVNVNFY